MPIGAEAIIVPATMTISVVKEGWGFSQNFGWSWRDLVAFADACEALLLTDNRLPAKERQHRLEKLDLIRATLHYKYDRDHKESCMKRAPTEVRIEHEVVTR